MTKFQTLLTKTKPGLRHLTLRAPADKLCLEASAAQWRCYVVDGSAIHDKDTFLAQFAAVLRFPAYFGNNWDAFEDCLNDLSWENVAEQKGIVILFDEADRFAKTNPIDWAIARDIFRVVAEEWNKAGKPMLVFVRGVSVKD